MVGLLRRRCVNYAPVSDGLLVLHESEPKTIALLAEQILSGHSLQCTCIVVKFHSIERMHSVQVLLHLDDLNQRVALPEAGTNELHPYWAFPLVVVPHS